MTKRAAIYLRVSTDGQTTENQRLVLEEVARQAGWPVVDVFEDKGISGAKGRNERPAFNRLFKAATCREFDVVMAWSVDRLGRSLQDLITFLGELHAVEVDLFLHQQGVDTTTPAGRAMFQMMGVFAEFERAMIRERVCAGLERAKANGIKLGRRSNIDPNTRQKALDLLASRTSIRKTAKALNLSSAGVQRIKKQVERTKELVATF